MPDEAAHPPEAKAASVLHCSARLTSALYKPLRFEGSLTQLHRIIEVVQPGGTLAILGGGQLGRMMAMAARTMGYHVRVMDPEPHCPASYVVDETIVGNWDDAEAAMRLATGANAVTLEIEQIGVDALERVAEMAPLRPGVEPVRIIQDKTLQKPWLSRAWVSRGAVSRGARRRGAAARRCGAGRECVPEDRARRI